MEFKAELPKEIWKDTTYILKGKIASSILQFETSVLLTQGDPHS